MVPVKKIEEAIQRQVISGGALDTVLLEVGAAAENVLASYVAAVHEMEPVTADEVMNVGRDVVRILPREIAEQHRIVPLSSGAGRVVLAVHEPLGGEDLRQIAFLLGGSIEQRVVTEVRIEAALSTHYGVELSPRLRRLARKLTQFEAGELREVAPLDDNRRVPLEGAAAKAPESTESSRYGARSGTTAKFGQVSPSKGNANAAAAVGNEVPTRKTNAATHFEATVIDTDRRTSTSIVPPAPGFDAQDANTSSFVDEVEDAPETSSTSLERPPATPLLNRIRGPFTARLAVELLEQSESREDILQVALAFVEQFFDCAAIFMVHDDVAEGYDVGSEGPSYAKVRQTTLSTEHAGVLTDAFRTATPRMGDLLNGTTADKDLAESLQRGDSQPCILAPVAIRQRVVLLFYGDRGGEDFGISDVPEFLAFMPRISEAFQRLILRRKSGNGTKKALQDSEQPEPSVGAIAKQWKSGRRNWVPEVGRSDQPKKPKARSLAMDALGVPRTAPPPPSPAAAAMARESLNAVEVRPIDAEGDPSESDDPEPAYVGRAADDPPIEVAPAPIPSSSRPPSGHTLLEGADLDEPLPDPSSDEAPEVVDPAERSEPTPAQQRQEREAPPETVDEPSSGPMPSEPSEPESPQDTLRETLPELHPPPALEEAPSEPPSEPRAEEPIELTRAKAKGNDSRVSVYSMKGRVEIVGKTRSSSRPPEKKQTTPPPEVSEARAPERSTAVDVVTSPTALPEAVIEPEAEPENSGRMTDVVRMSIDPGMPSVILDLGDNVEEVVADLLRASPEDFAPFQSALRAGEAILPALVREFPGPLWFDRHAPHQRLPHGRDISPIARAIANFGETAAPYVAALLDREDHDVRFYATLLAASIPHRDLVEPLGRRIFDVDAGTRALALDVLRPMARFRREFGHVIDRVRANARIPARPVPIRAAAVKALGYLRDQGALDLLVRMLDSSEDKLVDRAHASLVLITRQDFGTSRKAWLSWVGEHRDRSRIEWLIDALTHDDPKLRRLAGDELKHLTQQYYGYHYALSRREREVAQKKYRDWYEETTRDRYA